MCMCGCASKTFASAACGAAAFAHGQILRAKDAVEPCLDKGSQAKSPLHSMSIMETGPTCAASSCCRCRGSCGSARQRNASLPAAGCRCCRSSARPPAAAPRAPPRQCARPGTPAGTLFWDPSTAERVAGDYLLRVSSLTAASTIGVRQAPWGCDKHQGGCATSTTGVRHAGRRAHQQT